MATEARKNLLRIHQRIGFSGFSRITSRLACPQLGFSAGSIFPRLRRMRVVPILALKGGMGFEKINANDSWTARFKNERIRYLNLRMLFFGVVFRLYGPLSPRGSSNSPMMWVVHESGFGIQLVTNMMTKPHRLGSGYWT